jgi:hypothetical protein
MKYIILQGKKIKPNKRTVKHINIGVLSGLMMQLAWIVFLYPSVFIDITRVLTLLFLPGVLLTPFFYKKITTACGYTTSIAKNYAYNTLMPFLVFLMLSVSIGNTLVTFFLLSNRLIKDSKVETVKLYPFHVRESLDKNKHWFSNSKKYLSLELSYDGVEKIVRLGTTPISTIRPESYFELKVSKGLWGYYVIQHQKLKP